jgi:arsenite methyltransferase
MTTYLEHVFDLSSPELVDVYDELPLWSAIAGLLLLEHLPLSGHKNVLDVGCGTGFPMLELAERMGPGASVVGLDIWSEALDRAKHKAKLLEIDNAITVLGDAAKMPCPDTSFDLIVSNLGLNNFEDPKKVVAECYRVAQPGATIAICTNVCGHMQEFYNVFSSTLLEMRLSTAQMRLEAQIEHRATVESVSELLAHSGFKFRRAFNRTIPMRFSSGSALLRHSFIRMGFLEDWRAIMDPEQEQKVFERLEANLNRAGELTLTIPLAYIEAVKVK